MKNRRGPKTKPAIHRIRYPIFPNLPQPSPQTDCGVRDKKRTTPIAESVSCTIQQPDYVINAVECPRKITEDCRRCSGSDISKLAPEMQKVNHVRCEEIESYRIVQEFPVQSNRSLNKVTTRANLTCTLDQE